MHWIRDVFDVTRRCWLVIAMLALAWYALMINDQGSDVLTGFNDYPQNGWRHPLYKYLWMSILLLGWAFYTWFSARVTLHLSEFNCDSSRDPGREQRILVLERWIPLLLGLATQGIMAAAYIKYVHFYLPDLIFLAPAILFTCYAVRSKDIAPGEQLRAKPRLWKTMPFRTASRSVPELSRMTFTNYCILLALLLIVMLLILAGNVPFLIGISPLAIILTAFTLWTGFLTGLITLEKGYRVPAVLLIITATFLFSYINNNHAVRTLASKVYERPLLRQHFGSWLSHIHPAGKPILLVSGEGGGIRAGYWTAGFLARLHDELPESDSCLYALSTVSGSSLAAALYTTLRLQSRRHPGEPFLPLTDRFFHFDFLAPLTAAVVFPDLLQRFLPFPIPAWDRARFLEHSWEYSWEQVALDTAGRKSFSKGLTEIWWKDSAYSLPLVFFNNTKAENGERVITSAIRSPLLSTDLLDLMGKDIPLSAAASLSARFPFITPGAAIFTRDQRKWGTLVDGGYYDNSGTVTLQDVYREIRQVLRVQHDSVTRILVLVLQNGTHQDDTTSVLRQLYELRTVTSAFYNAWALRPDKQVEDLEYLLAGHHDTLIRVNLQRDPAINLPLGWYLSDSAHTNIRRQLEGPAIGKLIGKIGDYLRR